MNQPYASFLSLCRVRSSYDKAQPRSPKRQCEKMPKKNQKCCRRGLVLRARSHGRQEAGEDVAGALLLDRLGLDGRGHGHGHMVLGGGLEVDDGVVGPNVHGGLGGVAGIAGGDAGRGSGGGARGVGGGGVAAGGRGERGCTRGGGASAAAAAGGRAGVVAALGVVGDGGLGVAHLALGKLELLLLEGGALFAEALLGFLGLPAADGGEEGLEVVEEVGLANVEVPVEKAEELLLHEVDFGDAEAEVVVAADGSVAGPVLVLGGGVVEVLGGEDEGGEENAVDGAAHSLCHRRQTLGQPVEVDQRGHEGGDLNVRASNQCADEELNGRQRGIDQVGGLVRRGARRGRQALVGY